MFLDERGVEFHRVEVDMANKEHKRAPYTVAVNPAASVPALFDGDLHLGDSLDIMRYVDSHADGEPLFPADPQQLARVLAWVDRADTDFWDVSHHLYWQVIEPPAEGADPAETTRLYEKGHRILAELEAALAASAFVVGDTLTAADVALLPWVYGYKRFDLFHGDTLYPHVRAWRDRMIARASFKRNYKVAGEDLTEFLARTTTR